MTLRELEQQRRRDERERALDDARVLTIPQFAEVCGFSIWTAQRLLKAGRGPRLTQISDRRVGVTLGNLRRWQQARERA
jgi:predicted DNA-binding transcriptional regulator AlpA